MSAAVAETNPTGRTRTPTTGLKDLGFAPSRLHRIFLALLVGVLSVAGCASADCELPSTLVGGSERAKQERRMYLTNVGKVRPVKRGHYGLRLRQLRQHF
jgi:hypothetical protein